MVNSDTHGSSADELTGLTRDQAARQLASDGPNELPGSGPRSLLGIARQVLAEPMFLLLIAASAVYLVLGDLREAIVLSASMVIVVVITILQERRTEHALARLRDLSSPRALVVRDGVQQRIAGRDVVVGDIILLREGDRVPADGVVLASTAMGADESILTGESLPVDKEAGTDLDERSRVFSGSLISHGFGTARVTATGARTEMGRIGRALTTLTSEPTPLFQEVRRVVRWVATSGISLCVVIAIGYGLSRADWLGGVLAGITIAMSILPEEFPLVLTVFLAMGAWRISRVSVLTRRMPAVEAIGAATVLAVDKTGTLTENRMRLALIQTNDAQFDLRPGDVELTATAQDVLESALAASERDAFDPMERAIHEAARRLIPTSAAKLDSMALVHEYDLTPELLAVTHLWQEENSDALAVHVKGAPETVMELCRVDTLMREHLMPQVAAHTSQGLRVLGVARGTYKGTTMPASPREFELQWIGFVCLADPLRTDVPNALAECTRAGIRVVMITGDHPGTALAIATQAGFDTRGGALTGRDLETMDDSQLRARVNDINIYARTKPEHKLRLVQAFKANGEVIAMTGDGVNDAPALKAADIGVAMGGRGTDVAREAASIVLLNDDFKSLVAAVRLGRRIYSNIRHAMSYIVAVHIPLAGMGLLPVLFGWPLVFFPVHVLFLEFVIDPACAFVFEADKEAPDIMHRKPRRPDEPLFNRAMLIRSVLLGLLVLLFTAATYVVALDRLPENESRALVFVSLVISNLALIFVSRSGSANLATIYARHNAVFWIIIAVAIGALLAVIHIAPIADLFRFTSPPWMAAAGVAAAAIGFVLIAGSVLRHPKLQPH
jgi:P-type Ca2+ transporter type 2C